MPGDVSKFEPKIPIFLVIGVFVLSVFLTIVEVSPLPRWAKFITISFVILGMGLFFRRAMNP